MSEEDRKQRAKNAASNGLRVHTSRFRNRDKKWAGAHLRLRVGEGRRIIMPLQNKASSVPLTQGEELKEEGFTLDGDARAGLRKRPTWKKRDPGSQELDPS